MLLVHGFHTGAACCRTGLYVDISSPLKHTNGASHVTNPSACPLRPSVLGLQPPPASATALSHTAVSIPFAVQNAK